jgi:DNA-binding IclR family transcriptional regulator
MTDSFPIKTTRTTFRVAESIAELDRPRFGDVVHLEVPKSTVHDYLRSLEQTGYVVRTDDRYRLSSRFLQMCELTRHSMDLYNVAVPHVADLAEETGERLSLYWSTEQLIEFAAPTPWRISIGASVGQYSRRGERTRGARIRE